jgi:hypothetical protein
MSGGDESSKAGDLAQLRRIAGLMCLWRLCGNAACRRAKACRGRPRACARRNVAALPPEVRGFFEAFLAAKACGVPFPEFREKMAGTGEAEAYFAWAGAARGRQTFSQVRNKRDAPQNAA